MSGSLGFSSKRRFIIYATGLPDFYSSSAIVVIL
jgi:hypothetical protein